MKRLVAALALVALAACSGNFGTGTGMPQTGPGIPPMGAGTPMPPMDRNGMPINPSASPSPTPGTVGNATYPIEDAQKGFACGTLSEGYGCTLAFNLPPPTPTPSPSPKNAKRKSKTTATPSPTPTPTPTPTPKASASPSPGASAGASASPSPSPTPETITLQAQAPPKDAPKMVHVPANSLDTVALMMVQLTTNGDLDLDGWANAQFTLPKTEVDGRGFAVQLFQVNKRKKGVEYKPIWTFDKSTLNERTLTFSFQPPKMKIAKGSTYMLVLYGDDKSSAPSPAPSGSAPPLPADMNPAAAPPDMTPAPSPTP
ncbi:MAG TPA: hypothetical protein VJP85_03310 [Candidatus Baltobacteraceae bacterium]|nr:hypothetical protein [Candidatus Baltobacteraceae bacterium]